MILKCTCIHPAQDKFHGIGRRVHNTMVRTTGGQKYRCTVCKNERELSTASFFPNPVEPAKVAITK